MHAVISLTSPSVDASRWRHLPYGLTKSDSWNHGGQALEPGFPTTPACCTIRKVISEPIAPGRDRLHRQGASFAFRFLHRAEDRAAAQAADMNAAIAHGLRAIGPMAVAAKPRCRIEPPVPTPLHRQAPMPQPASSRDQSHYDSERTMRPYARFRVSRSCALVCSPVTLYRAAR